MTCYRDSRIAEKNSIITVTDAEILAFQNAGKSSHKLAEVQFAYKLLESTREKLKKNKEEKNFRRTCAFSAFPRALTSLTTQALWYE